MYINYEKIGNFLGFGKQFFYERKVAQNCSYVQKNIPKVKKKLCKKLENNSSLKVVFYVYDSSKWKSQSVYDFMVKDEHFEPLIVVTKNCCALENNPNLQTEKDVKKTYNFFKELGANVEYGYDVENNKFIPFEKFKPDIIFYSHPWYVERSQGPVVCSKFALTYYVPYFISDTEEWFEYDLRFHRYIYRYYLLNEQLKINYASKMPNKGANLKVVGHPVLDYFYLNNSSNENKYTIYAPHWTVAGNNIRYSTFDWNGYEILDFAAKHKELNWVFKPHPELYKQLFMSGYMTKEEADNYYKKWAEIGILHDKGGYLDLFNNSYAMITDSGSFLIEYFLTERPCIHLVSDGFKGNESSRKISESYYRAKNLDELNSYLEEILLKRNDPKKSERLRVLEELGLKNNYCAEKIIKDILENLC